MQQCLLLVPFTKKMNKNNFRQLVKIFSKARRALLNRTQLPRTRWKTSFVCFRFRTGCVCVCVIGASLLEIALTTGNPSTASDTLASWTLLSGSSFIRPSHFGSIHSKNFQSQQHNPPHQIFGRQVENCSASWGRQNPFLLAIFCNENFRNECAITCGNKFQILSHKGSVLKISNCKLTPAYLNFKMLISLCVRIATEERENISRHKMPEKC